MLSTALSALNLSQLHTASPIRARGRQTQRGQGHYETAVSSAEDAPGPPRVKVLLKVATQGREAEDPGAGHGLISSTSALHLRHVWGA